MPYNKISELPPAIKENLPIRAQRIFMGAFNSSYNSCIPEKRNKKICEDRAFRIAWYAVNLSYEKNKDGKWVKKT